MWKKHSDETAATADAKGRKFNFIDVLIILIILLVAAVVINIFAPALLSGKFSSGGVTKRIQYTVEFTGVDGEYIEMIKEGNTVVDSVSKYSLGSVAAVDFDTRYSELEYDEQNKAGVLSVYPDKYNLLVTVTVDAEYEDGKGFSVNDYRIAVGEKMALRFPDYVGEGYCVGLSVLN